MGQVGSENLLFALEVARDVVFLSVGESLPSIILAIMAVPKRVGGAAGKIRLATKNSRRINFMMGLGRKFANPSGSSHIISGRRGKAR